MSSFDTSHDTDHPTRPGPLARRLSACLMGISTCVGLGAVATPALALPTERVSIETHTRMTDGIARIRSAVPAGEVDLIDLVVDDTSRLIAVTHDEAEGCPADTTLTVRHRGEVIAFDDDGGEGLCSALDIMLEAGAYTLEVAGYAGGAVHTYSLDVDHATPIALDRPGRGLSGEGEADRFSFDWPGGPLVATLGDGDGLCPGDAFLSLRGIGGALFADDVDSGAHDCPRIEADLMAGRYILKASGFEGAELSAYEVQIVPGVAGPSATDLACEVLEVRVGHTPWHLADHDTLDLHIEAELAGSGCPLVPVRIVVDGETRLDTDMRIEPGAEGLELQVQLPVEALADHSELRIDVDLSARADGAIPQVEMAMSPFEAVAMLDGLWIGADESIDGGLHTTRVEVAIPIYADAQLARPTLTYVETVEDGEHDRVVVDVSNQGSGIDGVVMCVRFCEVDADVSQLGFGQSRIDLGPGVFETMSIEVPACSHPSPVVCELLPQGDTPVAQRAFDAGITGGEALAEAELDAAYARVIDEIASRPLNDLQNMIDAARADLDGNRGAADLGRLRDVAGNPKDVGLEADGRTGTGRFWVGGVAGPFGDALPGSNGSAPGLPGTSSTFEGEGETGVEAVDRLFGIDENGDLTRDGLPALDRDPTNVLDRTTRGAMGDVMGMLAPPRRRPAVEGSASAAIAPLVPAIGKALIWVGSAFAGGYAWDRYKETDRYKSGCVWGRCMRVYRETKGYNPSKNGSPGTYCDGKYDDHYDNKTCREQTAKKYDTYKKKKAKEKKKQEQCEPEESEESCEKKKEKAKGGSSTLCPPDQPDCGDDGRTGGILKTKVVKIEYRGVMCGAPNGRPGGPRTDCGPMQSVSAEQVTRVMSAVVCQASDCSHRGNRLASSGRIEMPRSACADPHARCTKR